MTSFVVKTSDVATLSKMDIKFTTDLSGGCVKNSVLTEIKTGVSVCVMEGSFVIQSHNIVEKYRKLSQFYLTMVILNYLFVRRRQVL